MSAILEISDLSVFYGGARALGNVGFSVKAGGVTAVLGANGAGKTTLLRAISGIVRSSGGIVFRGSEISGSRPERTAQLGIAHVPEDRGTFPSLSVEDNLRAAAHLRRRREVPSAFDEVYELFPVLRERRSQQAGTLSGGEQQMLAIGRALMLKPELLLLDEPSFGLAPKAVETLFGMLRLVNAKRGVSILIVEQNAYRAFELASDIVMLDMGSVALSGPAASLRDDPRMRGAYFGEL